VLYHSRFFEHNSYIRFCFMRSFAFVKRCDSHCITLQCTFNNLLHVHVFQIFTFFWRSQGECNLITNEVGDAFLRNVLWVWNVRDCEAVKNFEIWTLIGSHFRSDSITVWWVTAKFWTKLQNGAARTQFGRNMLNDLFFAKNYPMYNV